MVTRHTSRWRKTYRWPARSSLSSKVWSSMNCKKISTRKTRITTMRFSKCARRKSKRCIDYSLTILSLNHSQSKISSLVVNKRSKLFELSLTWILMTSWQTTWVQRWRMAPFQIPSASVSLQSSLSAWGRWALSQRAAPWLVFMRFSLVSRCC